jgi:predicted RNase H-like HicB family nuclease
MAKREFYVVIEKVEDGCYLGEVPNSRVATVTDTPLMN